MANFAGDFPGLVGLLNLTGSMIKAGIDHSALWSKDFTDDWFKGKFDEWLKKGTIKHDTSHVAALPQLKASPEKELGVALAEQLASEKAIMAVFDEGCMGMYNAIIDDELLNPHGIYKERLSQSALVAEMNKVSDEEAQGVYDWLKEAGMTFHVDNDGDEKENLTDAQVLEQCKMYIAALRISDDFGADLVGIQYQQGLKDMVPASDLVEGLLHDPHRPDFVWVLEISGAVPASHLGGYQNAHGYRQSYYFFPLGGSTLQGTSKPGEIVWSRVFVKDNALHVDLGRGTCIEMPEEEVQRRLDSTNPEWPIMNAILHGVSRDQMMARHPSNHLNVAYAPDAETADKALVAKAAMFEAMGYSVNIAGDVKLG